MNNLRKIWHAFAFIGVLAAAVAIVMLLWNALIPSIIGWSAINYWQAGGLLILLRLLVGGFGRHFQGGHFHAGHFHGRHPFHDPKTHAHFHEKLKGMTRDEKREYIRSRMADMHDPERSSRPK